MSGFNYDRALTRIKYLTLAVALVGTTALLLTRGRGAAAGFLAGAVVKGHGFGILGNLIVGVIGALVGGFIFGLLGIATTNILGSLICAFVGAVVLLLLLGFVGRKGR